MLKDLIKLRLVTQKFDEPIALAKGKALRTLRDAGNYITAPTQADAAAAGMADGSGNVDARGRRWRAPDVRLYRHATGDAVEGLLAGLAASKSIVRDVTTRSCRSAGAGLLRWWVDRSGLSHHHLRSDQSR